MSAPGQDGWPQCLGQPGRETTPSVRTLFRAKGGGRRAAGGGRRAVPVSRSPWGTNLNRIPGKSVAGVPSLCRAACSVGSLGAWVGTLFRETGARRHEWRVPDAVAVSGMRGNIWDSPIARLAFVAGDMLSTRAPRASFDREIHSSESRSRGDC